jgi:hypothetical protein
MGNLNWSASRNPLISCTKRNNRKMDAISTDLDAKLFSKSADPLFTPIYNAYHPVYQTFHKSYVDYKTAISEWHGSTAVIEGFWKDVSSKLIDKWDTSVKGVYEKGSDKHKLLFPKGHEIFRVGPYQERISNIESFQSLLATDPTLAASATMVQTFLTEYAAAFNVHTANKLKVKDLSDELKVNNKACAVAMFKVLGSLIVMFAETPEKIENYFLIDEIMKSTPKDEGGLSDEKFVIVPGGQTVEAGIPFKDTTKIKVYNPGTEILYLFTMATNDGSNIPETAHMLIPEDEEVIEMYTLGEAGNRYFFIGNKETDEGSISIEIVE